MKNLIQTAKSYLSTHKKSFTIGAGITVIVIAILLAVWLVLSRGPSYEAVRACDMLTVARAQKLLGAKVNNVEADKPIVVNNVATSKCGYGDMTPDHIKVAALLVKSAVNDKGIDELHAAFKQQKSNSQNTDVADLADSAYFNAESGILYVLDARKVLVISYGSGDNPQTNDSAKLVDIARSLLKQPTNSKN